MLLLENIAIVVLGDEIEVNCLAVQLYMSHSEQEPGSTRELHDKPSNWLPARKPDPHVLMGPDMKEGLLVSKLTPRSST